MKIFAPEEFVLKEYHIHEVLLYWDTERRNDEEQVMTKQTSQTSALERSVENLLGT